MLINGTFNVSINIINAAKDIIETIKNEKNLLLIFFFILFFTGICFLSILSSVLSFLLSTSFCEDVSLGSLILSMILLSILF